jgi:hypothetical protein
MCQQSLRGAAEGKEEADRWTLLLEEHLEHLVLYHAELVAISGAAEVGPALLA